MIDAAVIGLGWWGRTIVQTMRDSAAMRIVAGADPNPAAADFAAEQGLRMLPSLDAVLQDPSIKAVILCTPHTQHAAQVAQTAAAGRHVFCEKPLCLTRADALAAVRACEAAGVVLGIGHERRFEPPVEALRDLLESGVLGTALQIEANFSQDKFLALPADNWRLSGAEAPAGPMTATGIHLLDLCCSLLGPAQSVLCSVAQLGSELANGDTLAALIRFRSGAQALLTAILATPFDGRLALYGSKGWAEIRDKAHPESSEGWVMTTVLRGQPRQVQEFPATPAVRRNLDAFGTAAAGGAPYPVSHQQMVRTIAALEAVFRSAKTGEIQTVEGDAE